jgi:hypothetical protein
MREALEPNPQTEEAHVAAFARAIAELVRLGDKVVGRADSAQLRAAARTFAGFASGFRRRARHAPEGPEMPYTHPLWGSGDGASVEAFEELLARADDVRGRPTVAQEFRTWATCCAAAAAALESVAAERAAEESGPKPDEERRVHA